MAIKDPFVTKKVAGMYLIQKGGEDHDAEWLTPEGTWDKSVFEAAGYKTRKAALEALKALKGC